MQEAARTPNVARIISCKAWNSAAEYPSWVARCDIKGSDGTMLNPIFWKKVQGQKHSGRWGIVEHKIPSIKVLFKTNVKSHKHPGIKLLSFESKRHNCLTKENRTHIEEHIYIYIIVEKSPNSSHMYDHGFMDNTNRQAVCKSQKIL